MDKHRITFKCHTAPRIETGLKGFQIEQHYVGRSYNGLYEITPRWGSGKPTILINAADFHQYFSLTDAHSRLRQLEQPQPERLEKLDRLPNPILSRYKEKAPR